MGSEFHGKFIQGHFILGKTNPDAKVFVGKKKVKVSKDGFFVFGLDRDRKIDVSIVKLINGKKEIIIKSEIALNIMAFLVFFSEPVAIIRCTVI